MMYVLFPNTTILSLIITSSKHRNIALVIAECRTTIWFQYFPPNFETLHYMHKIKKGNMYNEYEFVVYTGIFYLGNCELDLDSKGWNIWELLIICCSPELI